LTDKPLECQSDWIVACRRLIDDRRADMVALTLGDEGALLVSRDKLAKVERDGNGGT
jgi:6-phosphofructokinase 2